MKVFIGPFPDENYLRKIEVIVQSHDIISLNQTIAFLLVPLLEYFQDHIVALPYRYTKEEWKDIIARMIYGFRQYQLDNLSGADEEAVDDALELFQRHFRDLWRV